MLLLTISSPVYADDPCEGAGCDGDCGMEVNIGVSDNSEVNVNTGDNSEVELNTGACNDVFINGQDINQPTIIHHQVSNYKMIYSQRLAKLEGWRSKTITTVNLVADGLAKLISEYEAGKVTEEELNSKLLELESGVSSIQLSVNALSSEYAQDKEASLATIEDLRFQVEYLRWLVDKNNSTLTWWILGLAAGLSVVGGLMIYRTRRRNK